MEDKNKEQFSTMDSIMSIFFWWRIVLGMVLGGAFFGFVALLAIGYNTVGIIVAAIIAVAFSVTGVRWAEKARKGIGTVAFTARRMANPELDNMEQYDKDKMI